MLPNLSKIENKPNPTAKTNHGPLFNPNQNFNLLFFWEEVESALRKIITYLQENKISEEIREILKDIKKPNQEKLENVVNILDKALLENPTEQLNIFFLEFYRLASLYFFCMEIKIKAYDIVEKFLKRINFNFKGKIEKEIDVNILVERDKFILNKAQMYFWDEKLIESLELIDGRLSYFRLDTTDEYYCYKIFPIIISSLCYKGWTHAIQNKEIDARNAFILAIDYANSYEEWLTTYFKNPDLSEAYKRRIKAYHQYLNYLIFKIDNSANNYEKLDLTKESHSMLIEMLKLISNEKFKFDSEILKSHILLYHLQACLYSLNLITIREEIFHYQNTNIKMTPNMSMNMPQNSGLNMIPNTSMNLTQNTGLNVNPNANSKMNFNSIMNKNTSINNITQNGGANTTQNISMNFNQNNGINTNPNVNQNFKMSINPNINMSQISGVNINQNTNLAQTMYINQNMSTTQNPNMTQNMIYYQNMNTLDKDAFIKENVALAEQALINLTNAFVQNNTLDLQFKVKFRNTMVFLIFKLLKYLKIDNNIFKAAILKKKKETESVLNIVEDKLIELIGNFDDSGKLIPTGKYLTNTVRDYTYVSTYIKNYALHNISRFNKHTKKEKINETINEIFTIEYICNKLLLIIASIMKDSIEIFPNFDDSCLVIESLNGYLIAKEDSLTLVIMKSFVIDYIDKTDIQNAGGSIENHNNKLLYEIHLEKTERFFELYSKHVFAVNKLTFLDIFTNLAVFNSFYSLGLYKHCITIIDHILNELRNLKDEFYSSDDNLGYLDLYRFFALIVVKLYMKIGDFYPAILVILDIEKEKDRSEEDKELCGYSDFVLFVLNGVCLSKINYSDLSAVYLNIAKIYVSECFDKIMESSKADKNKALENSGKDKIRPNYDNICKFFELIYLFYFNTFVVFTTPIKMFISVLDMMISKAEEKSIVELYSNNFYCYSCKEKIDFTPPLNLKEDENNPAIIDETPKKSVYCEKCKRIYYCSFDCLKKMKPEHIPICVKYCQYHLHINEVVDKINKLKNPNTEEE